MSNAFLDVFAKSPIKPLEQHINVALQVCKCLSPLFAAAYSEDWDEVSKIYDEIIELEKKANGIKHEIRLNLPGRLFLPVDRGDALELLAQQDSLVDVSKKIASHVLIRELVIPVALRESFDTYLAKTLAAAEQANHVINELDELLETGFRGREVVLVESMIETLAQLEGDVDRIRMSIGQSLKGVEHSVSSIDMMFLYNLVDWIGDLAETAERVASRLELMLAQ